MSNFKKEFKEFIQLLREKNDYFLSHHPMCSRFDDDVYHFAGKRLCIGCFTAYPIALFILLIWVLGYLDIPLIYMFLIGSLFGSFQFLSLTRISDVKVGKISIKICLGVGMGFFTIGIFSLPLNWFLRLLLFLICVNVVGFYSFLRMKKINKICARCENNRDLSNCSGFR